MNTTGCFSPSNASVILTFGIPPPRPSPTRATTPDAVYSSQWQTIGRVKDAMSPEVLVAVLATVVSAHAVTQGFAVSLPLPPTERSA